MILIHHRKSWGLEARDIFQVTRSGSILQLNTPYGQTTFLGDKGFEKLKSFSLEVPIANLRGELDGGGLTGGWNSGGESGAKPDEVAMEQMLLEADRLFNEGALRESLRYIDEIIRRDPKFSRGWMMKGSVLYVLGQKDLAKKAWVKAYTLDPANEQLRGLLGAKKP